MASSTKNDFRSAGFGEPTNDPGQREGIAPRPSGNPSKNRRTVAGRFVGKATADRHLHPDSVKAGSENYLTIARRGKKAK